MMTSCQIAPSQNKAEFRNVENLQKLTVNKFCEKSQSFISNRIVVSEELKKTQLQPYIYKNWIVHLRLS